MAAGIAALGGVDCEESVERAGGFTGGRGGNADGRTGGCPAEDADGVAGSPLGRCGGMKGRGPAAIVGRGAPIAPACPAGLTGGVLAPVAGVGGVTVLDADAAGVCACVGAVTRGEGVSVRVGRGGAAGAGAGVGDEARAGGASGANDRGALDGVSDWPPSAANDEIVDGCVVAVLELVGVGVGAPLESGSPAAPCGACGSPSSEPCEPCKEGPTVAAPSGAGVSVLPPSLPCEPCNDGPVTSAA